MSGPGESPVRILVLCDYGGPYGGSFVPTLRATATAARARGMRVACGFTSIARDRAWLADLKSDGIECRIAPDGGRATLREWVRTWLAEGSGPTVIHTHFTAFEVAALTAAGEVPVIWHAHTHLPSRPRLVARAVVKYAWYGRRVAAIACVSEAIATAVRRRGAPRAKLTVIENGIDLERFGLVGEQERAAARRSLGLDDAGPVLLHIGWDWEAKGGPLFAATLRGLRDLGIEAVGLTVGGGAPAAAAARELELGEALVAVQPAEDVRRFYAAADLLVATSIGEGAPFALLESLSCGLGVVATDVPGHRLEPEPPRALRVVAADPAALAEAVAIALERRTAEAREAHDWVALNRGLATTAERVAALYVRVLGR